MLNVKPFIRPIHNLLSKVFRRLVLSRLQYLRHGLLRICENGNIHLFGDPKAEIQVTLFVHDSNFFDRLAVSGALGAADSLIAGEWSADDLVGLVRIFIRNIDLADGLDTGLGKLRQWIARWTHIRRKNSIAGSARNIQEHYDLGNDFFELMLDGTMNYSSGIHLEPNMQLYEASLTKMERVCRKLDLLPTDHLLEIGSGWGGLAIFAAQKFGCRVTTTTISKVQFEWVKRKVFESGLSSKVVVLLKDYRDLSGSYDKLVSIEMIEAVGSHYHASFFEKCGQLLTEDGVMLLQGITIPEKRYERYLSNVDFIRHYIFPGGSLPSITALTQAASVRGHLRLLHLEDIGPHYAQTLRAWRSRFLEHLNRVRELGYSERFIRMWNYYLAYCEAAFEERHIGNVQMVFGTKVCRFDPIFCSWNHEYQVGKTAHASHFETALTLPTREILP